MFFDKLFSLVVSSKEMKEIEERAYSQGADQATLMDLAGKGIADVVDTFCKKNSLPKVVTLAVGKGNNGGDAYTTGAILLDRGYVVKAYHLFDLERCSSLCKQRCHLFEQKGGKVFFSWDQMFFEGVILDGILGIGFHGILEEKLLGVISLINQSHLPVLSIDVPSGLDADQGGASGAVVADVTICLGLPKIGLFLDRAMDYVGELVFVDLGFKTQPISAKGYILSQDEVKNELPPIKKTRHKYESGYILALAGSSGMTGAASLSTKAALRSGAGIVRLFHPHGIEDELSACAVEVIKEGYEDDCIEQLWKEARRAGCMFVGPGLGRNKTIDKLLKKIFIEIHLPLVIDADALFFLAENLYEIPPNAILTPHRMEMERFFSKQYVGSSFLDACQSFAKKHQIIIVLKGMPTIIFSPNHLPVYILRGDPGMATAGSGDVLTGVISALVAQGLEPFNAAVAGAYIHAMAGEFAAKSKTSYCMIASDIIDHLPEAFLSLKQGCLF